MRETMTMGNSLCTTMQTVSPFSYLLQDVDVHVSSFKVSMLCMSMLINLLDKDAEAQSRYIYARRNRL